PAAPSPGHGGAVRSMLRYASCGRPVLPVYSPTIMEPAAPSPGHGGAVRSVLRYASCGRPVLPAYSPHQHGAGGSITRARRRRAVRVALCVLCWRHAANLMKTGRSSEDQKVKKVRTDGRKIQAQPGHTNPY
ncbi:hypothetical protein JW905_16455, partial [bacterium]|nr:hypothetical protein [candidate division CSSED10-310 bacterium]